MPEGHASSCAYKLLRRVLARHSCRFKLYSISVPAGDVDSTGAWAFPCNSCYKNE